MDDPYSASNLRLDAGNMRFRAMLLEAAHAAAVPAAILATIITAEALMRPAAGGVTWDEFSRNDLGSAAGLAQFTRASWLAHAVRAGGVLNAAARAAALIDPDGQVLDEAALLDLRFDPRLSVAMTAEMTRRNWDYLRARRLPPEDQGPGALAKILYLAHHEGAEGAYRYLIGARPEVSRARFESNVLRRLWTGGETAPERTRIYFAWLEDYIDRRIDVRRYLLDSRDVAVPRLAHLGRRRPYRLLHSWLRQQKARNFGLRRRA